MISNYKLHAIDMVRSGQLSAKELVLDIYDTMAHRDLADNALQVSGINLNGHVSVEELIKFLEHVRDRDVYDSLAMNGHVPDMGDMDDSDDSEFGSDTLHESMNGLVSELLNGNRVKEKSFKDYVQMVEDIVPPSGQTIGPSANTTAPTGTTPAPGAAPAGGASAMWPGKGTPVEVGMTVGTTGPNGLPVPGQVSQVDMASKGVKIKNPTTGQEEWQNTDNLKPYMVNGPTAPATAGTPGTGVNSADQQPGIPAPTTEDIDLARMRQLAGIKENCSAGATGAGSIAVAPAAMGSMQKRKTEYTRTEPVKSIIGDTKPHQASGKLSADLVANGKRAAGRANNGMKKQR